MPNPRRAGQTLSAPEARALMAVVADLADDFAVACAIAIVDGHGHLRVAERPEGVPGWALDAAVGCARSALDDDLGGSLVAHGAAALAIEGAEGVRGALGVWGGPEGFPIEACRVAVHALGASGRRAA